MIKIENKKIQTAVCVSIECDVCNTSVRLESDSDVPSNLNQSYCNDLSRTPGRHIVHHFGYGTELDSDIIEITLCDNCLFNMFSQYVKVKEKD